MKSNIIRNNGDEIKLNAKINKTNLFHISGYVCSFNSPIKNACIKITSSNFNPLFHVYTDANGYFTLTNNIPKLFRIIVSKNNYKVFSSNIILRSKIKSPIKINIKEKISKNIVIGKLIDLKRNPIGYANVEIKKINRCVTTNVNGEFIFEDIPYGCHVLSIISPFYHYQKMKLKVLENQRIFDLKCIKLRPKPYTGTVNGVIYDKKNYPVKDAIVMLINEDTNNIIDYTYTNEMGVYLFGNVPLGRYYIKSNK